MLAAAGKSVLQHLSYGRIIGAAGAEPVGFATGTCETILFARRGLAFALVDEEIYELYAGHRLMVPRGKPVQVYADGPGCELIEISAPAEGESAVRLIEGQGADEGLALRSWVGEVDSADDLSERIVVLLEGLANAETTLNTDDCLLIPQRAALGASGGMRGFWVSAKT